ncbi:hypothetical protein PMZ80_002494 [Knufia obscura]|uniref:Histone-lysine N-methyltransferase n=1 Tax=Knufia obscura TaxID=1635080 RepID=A0ABR0RYC4_9EURO|nr:hypothetical protein PMZ80_002494 [Knufia obscura]
MAVAINGKRPYDNGLQRSGSTTTSDSYNTPPLTNNGLSQQRSAVVTGKTSINNNLARNKTVQITKSQSPPFANGASRISHADRQSRPTHTEDISDYPSIEAFQKPKGLSNGIRDLSLRPSPRPKQSRSPDVIDLDTNSEHSRKSNGLRSSATLKRDRSLSPVRSAGYHSTFFTQNLKPIVFDPTRPELSKTKTTTVTPRDDSKQPVGRKPLVQIPPRRQLLSSSATPISKVHQLPSSQTHSKSHVLVKLPPHPSQVQTRSKEIIKALKQDVSYIKDNPAEVSEIVGVLPFDDTDLDTKARRRAKQMKHKKVDHNRLALDFDSLSLQSSTPQASATQLVHPRQQARQILHERFKQSQHSALSFENRRNTRQLNGKFQFVSDYIFSKKIKSKKQAPLQSRDCQCIGGCGLHCACLPPPQTTIDANGVEQTINIQTYRRRQDGLVVLSDEFIDRWSDKIRIFECGEYCSCPQNCPNRVVQKGRQIPLQVFETQHCGFGVRSSQNIVRGQFVDVYLGEVLTNSEVDKREAAAEEDTPSYVMSLDVFIQDEQSMFYVDGEVFGSVTRFVNHSCEPNCKTLPVVLSNGTKHLYHVAFFAIKDIPAGTELTIDYDPGLAQAEEILDASVVQCRCGSANCRKRLWRPSKEKRGRKKLLPSKDDD